MNLLNSPDLLDRLAASHALGTLRGGARRRFETLARQNPTIRAAALVWQERFASMTELQQSAQPSANVWKRIENLIEAEPARFAAAPVARGAGESALLARLRRSLGLWRGAALAGALAGVAAVVVGVNLNREMAGRGAELAQVRQQNSQLVAKLQAAPEIRYVAVLANDQAAASMLVTFDPKNKMMTLKRVDGFEVASDKSLQLWALPPSGGPQSLGVLGGQAVDRMPMGGHQPEEMPALAVSLEPRGGVTGAGGPTGPVLFKGRLLQTTL